MAGYPQCEADRPDGMNGVGAPGKQSSIEAQLRATANVIPAHVLQRIEERDGGVYVELETVALSRGIPVEFRWLIKPLTDELPRRLMLDMLNDTRIAVRREAESSRSQEQN